MTGFDYGNARIRARRTHLFERADYDDLLMAPDVAALIGTLGSGPYGADVEAHIPRFVGVRLVDAAIDEHVARELRDMCSFYESPIRDRLELLLGRWDVQNLVAMTRVLGRSAGTVAASTTLVPAGRMGRPVLEELAAQPGVRGMLDLVAAWRVPSPEIAAAARQSIAAFDLTGDPLVVEASIQRGFASEVATVLATDHRDRLTRQLAAERLAADVLTAARLREARLAGEDLPDLDHVWIEDGPLGRSLRDLVWAPEVMASVVAMEGAEPGFADALRAWAVDADSTRLADSLTAALVRMAHAGYGSDPLGIGVPVAYTWDVENEARNLRLVVRSVAHGLDAAFAAERVFLP